MSKEYWNQSETLGIRVYRGASAAMMIGGSLLGTALLHSGEDHQWHLSVPSGTETLSTDTVTLPAGEPYAGVETVTVADLRPVQVQEEHRFDYAQGVYARGYEDDPAAREVDKPAAERIKEVIEGLKQDGWTDFRLLVEGRASAEDDLSKIDAGLSSDSSKNIELANQRRNSFINYLINDDFFNDVQTEPQPSVEKPISKEDIGRLRDLAQYFGYDGISQMVEVWNTAPETTPLEVDASLSALLQENRGVVVTIVAEKDGGMNGFPATKEQAVCYLPVSEQTVKHVRGTESEMPVPKFFIQPFPAAIPLFRRRKGQAALTPSEQAAAGRTMKKTGYGYDVNAPNSSRTTYPRGTASPDFSHWEVPTPPVTAIAAKSQLKEIEMIDPNGDDFEQTFRASLRAIDGIGDDGQKVSEPAEVVTSERRHYNIKGGVIIAAALGAGIAFLSWVSQYSFDTDANNSNQSGATAESSQPACTPGMPQHKKVVRTLPTTYVQQN